MSLCINQSLAFILSLPYLNKSIVRFCFLVGSSFFLVLYFGKMGSRQYCCGDRSNVRQRQLIQTDVQCMFDTSSYIVSGILRIATTTANVGIELAGLSVALCQVGTSFVYYFVSLLRRFAMTSLVPVKRKIAGINNEECPVCFQEFRLIIVRCGACGYEMCMTCMFRWCTSVPVLTCPHCRRVAD